MPPIRFDRRIGVRPLAARLLVYVLLFCVLLSLAATGVQMIGEVDRRTSELRSTQEKAAELVAGSMSNNLWLMNYPEVANSLDDMRAIPAIQHARIITTSGEEFSTGTTRKAALSPGLFRWYSIAHPLKTRNPWARLPLPRQWKRSMQTPGNGL